ncbi:MAG: hypothetical protein P4M04_12475 [Acidobacteriota bacterium]|nr:hypothetical protein [Acidobacteriota bacterium]
MRPSLVGLHLADARDALLCYLRVGPIYDGIRSDPRYEDILYRISLADSSESRVKTATHQSSGVKASRSSS